MCARHSFCQSAPNSDFLAEILSKPVDFLRLNRELKSGQMLVLVETSWPWKLQVPTSHRLVAACDALVVRWSRRDSVDEMTRKLPLASSKRSEERRVGKECRYRWSSEHYKKIIREIRW